MYDASRNTEIQIEPPLGLSQGWCDHAMDLLANRDASGLIESEVSRVKKANATRLKNRGVKGRGEPEAAIRQTIREDIHNRYATSVVRKEIFESIVSICWEAVCAHGVEHQYGGKQSADATSVRKEIGRRLGATDTTIVRWAEGEQLPEGEKVLAAIILVLQREILDISFPSRDSIVSQVARRTVALIRDNELLQTVKADGRRTRTKKPKRLPSGEELFVVRTALRHKDSDALLPRVPPGKYDDAGLRNAKKRCFRATIREIKKNVPKPTISEPPDIANVIETWSDPYVLFCIGLASGWREDLTLDDLPGWEALDELDPTI